MNSLSSYRNLHKDETIVVCGCGESLNDFTDPGQFVTIGVNDVGRLFDPTYLVVLNPKRQFKKDRFPYVEKSRAQAIFTQLDLGLRHPRVVRFKLGKRGGADQSDPDSLPYTNNSPYVALCLAIFMGAQRIGLIGVDFTEHHFFGKTGRHTLNNQFAQINKEYEQLAKAGNAMGVDVVNLSPHSRLTAFPRSTMIALSGENQCDVTPVQESEAPSMLSGKRIFFVNYKFLSCGTVFSTGLRHAAQGMGIVHEDAYWDDRQLPAKVRAFQPDLLFVVHGRNFVKRWRKEFQSYNKAVWLLDEPYEVDDTSGWSGYFDTVFVNDPSTLDRHHNAHYLPVGYDPEVYLENGCQRTYDVGFIGGYNKTREQYLLGLQNNGLLSYVVGGPWRAPALRNCSLSNNIPAEQTATLYQQTRIVVNVFRDIHHFNRSGIRACSLNPRIYEALACGALIVSEKRPEIQRLFPELPVFEGQNELVALVRDFLNNYERFEMVRKACHARLGDHTYGSRLKEILSVAGFDPRDERAADKGVTEQDQPSPPARIDVPAPPRLDDWEDFGNIVQSQSDGVFTLSKGHDTRPGTERGLVSKKRYTTMNLSFEMKIPKESCFIAKIHQADQYDQLTNSYHLICSEGTDYFARHNHIYRSFRLDRNRWERITISRHDGTLELYRGNERLVSIHDGLLTSGYAFLGIKGGSAVLRNVMLDDGHTNEKQVLQAGIAKGISFTVLQDSPRSEMPLVSIITTVYDRVECLRSCIRSVKNLEFKNYEHIIVADAPPDAIREQLHEIVRKENNGKITFLTLGKRHNNWGIAPASVGLRLARGTYVCFLSDDNGYTSGHFGPLIKVLDGDQHIGFAYSSCKYAGRRLLDSPVPRPIQIDLGQPLFRRELFTRHLQDALPFNEFAWDWRMIDHFMKKGVQWKHVNVPSFLFRLACYSQYQV